MQQNVIDGHHKMIDEQIKCQQWKQLNPDLLLQGGLPVHLRGKGLGPDGRVHPLLRLHVLQDLARALYFRRHTAQ